MIKMPQNLPGRVIDRFWSKVDRSGSGCHLWTARSKNSGGYGSYPFLLEGKKYSFSSHRFAWAVTHGDPGELWVLHHCDVRLCVRVDSHLFLGTRADNVQDMVIKGRSPRNILGQYGERSPHHTLTQDQVDEIRARASLGETQQSIADSFGCSQTNIGHIVRGKTWRTN